MTEVQPTVSYVPPPPPRGIFGTKIPSSVAFAIGALLFFLPFVDIKCNGMPLMRVSGVELATGFHVKSPGSDNSLLGGFEKMNMGDAKTTKKGEKKDPNIFAMAALGLGVLGLILSLLNAKAGGIGGLVTGVLSAAAMIGLMINIKKDVRMDTGGSTGNDTMGLDKMGQQMTEGVNISADFTPWFYVSLIAFLAAAFLSYKRMTTK